MEPRHVRDRRRSLRIGGAPFDGPRLSPVARLYHDDARWHHGRLELQSAVAPVYDFQLRMPGPGEILRAACSAAGASYELGDKGRQVQGVWALAPDPSMFRRQLVIDVIRVLTPDCSRELIRQLKAVDGLTEQDKRELKSLAAANRVTVRTLADIRSILCLGAEDPEGGSRAAGSGNCGHRGTRAAGRLPGLPGAAPCTPSERPGRRLPARAAEPRPSTPETPSREAALHYRINTLVQTLSLNGGLAPLAATALLASQGAHVVPGAEIFHAGRGRRGGRPARLAGRETLFAGEAKMSAAQFAEADHRQGRRQVRAARRRASTTRCACRRFPPPNRDAIQAACDKAEIALVVFGPEELLAP